MFSLRSLIFGSQQTEASSLSQLYNKQTNESFSSRPIEETPTKGSHQIDDANDTESSGEDDDPDEKTVKHFRYVSLLYHFLFSFRQSCHFCW